jgi:hypothetical protein
MKNKEHQNEKTLISGSPHSQPARHSFSDVWEDDKASISTLKKTTRYHV